MAVGLFQNPHHFTARESEKIVNFARLEMKKEKENAACRRKKRKKYLCNVRIDHLGSRAHPKLLVKEKFGPVFFTDETRFPLLD